MTTFVCKITTLYAKDKYKKKVAIFTWDKLMQNEICPFDDHFLKISNGCSRGTILMQIKIVSCDVMG